MDILVTIEQDAAALVSGGEAVAGAVGGFLKGMAKQLWDVEVAAAKAGVKDGAAMFMQTVQDVVLAAEKNFPAGAGEQKFAYVYDNLSKDLPGMGLTIGEKLLNGAIEAAVANLPMLLAVAAGAA